METNRTTTKTTTRDFDNGAMDTFETLCECTARDPKGALNYIEGCIAGSRCLRNWHERRAGVEHGVAMWIEYNNRMRRLRDDLRAERNYRGIDYDRV